MNRKLFLRWFLLLTALAVAAGALIREGLPREQSGRDSCLGVSIRTPEDLGTRRSRDYSQDLKLDGEPAAVDTQTATIYISQKIEEATGPADLKGILTLDIPGVRMSFAQDSHWDDLPAAVRQGHRFRLLLCGPADSYTQYDVVFTTLPLVSLGGSDIGRDGEGRSLYAGWLTLWDPEGGIATSRLRWNARGGTTINMDKQSWKLNLKNWDGGNNSEDLLGMGSDDDWILNAMAMEDSNVREKLFMDLWNEMAAQTDYNYPMSCAEYVEAVINGQYYGLYLLQRRVDDKYLSLDREDVLVKATGNEPPYLYEFFSPSDSVIPQAELDDFFLDLNCGGLNRENFVDVSLFLNLFAARDNGGRNVKNTFYVFDRTEEGTAITLIPWDTDMSLGARWDPDTHGFAYDYAGNVTAEIRRRELDAMTALYPDLEQDMNRRWSQLRTGLLRQDSIFSRLDGDIHILEASGADLRDRQKWGLYYGGEDTLEKLRGFVEDRLAFLDERYG